MRMAVLGAGVSGLATSLAMARDGHDVVLIERDEIVVGEPLDAPAWRRQGIPHFLQAHAFRSRGRRELRTHFPNVFGVAVHATARVMALGQLSEIVISSVTRRLAEGSGFRFEERGSHQVKGLDQPIEVFLLTGA